MSPTEELKCCVANELPFVTINRHGKVLEVHPSVDCEAEWIYAKYREVRSQEMEWYREHV